MQLGVLMLLAPTGKSLDEMKRTSRCDSQKSLHFALAPNMFGSRRSERLPVVSRAITTRGFLSFGHCLNRVQEVVPRRYISECAIA